MPLTLTCSPIVSSLQICECPETCCITDIAPVAVAKSRERDLSEGTGRLSWAVCDMLR